MKKTNWLSRIITRVITILMATHATKEDMRSEHLRLRSELDMLTATLRKERKK